MEERKVEVVAETTDDQHTVETFGKDNGVMDRYKGVQKKYEKLSKHIKKKSTRETLNKQAALLTKEKNRKKAKAAKKAKKRSR